ncbi:hypothetical protein, partial [Paraburkholderia caballeronis]|uniref:hypothetical protein n=1 Tax=Paraburkholderia caballeronis TaxID=416943 RepID=UPI0014170705
YIEFGSAMAVDALIQHALRDALRARAAVAQAGTTLTENQLEALLALADRIERAEERPIPISLEGASLIRALAAHPSTGEGEPISKAGDAQ